MTEPLVRAVRVARRFGDIEALVPTESSPDGRDSGGSEKRSSSASAERSASRTPSSRANNSRFSRAESRA